VEVTRRKTLADVAAGVPAGLWVGLAVCLAVFVPFGVLSAAAAGRLVRAGASWPRVLAGYFERCAPVMMLIGLPAANLGAAVVTGGRAFDGSVVRTALATQLAALAVATAAVYRRWWWPVRLALHAAWLFAVFYW
jgi:hypothetical protein